jgi:4-carboxymuconolactone decarboxylase
VIDDTKPRIAPILPPDWDAQARAAMDTLPLARDNIVAGFKAGTPPLGMNAVCTMLNHPAMATAFLSFNAHFFYSSKLPPRVREFLIMRIAWRCHTEGEYLAHVAIAKRVGISDLEVQAVQEGPDSKGLAPQDADLIRAVDELRADARISESTWSRLAQQFDQAQLLEIVFIVGCYEVLAMVFNSCNVQPESGAKMLDAPTRARLQTS